MNFIFPARKIFIFAVSLFFSLNLFAREDTILDSGWKFKLGDAGEDVLKNNFKDALWQTVSVPHCWGWQDAQLGKEYYQGPGWYRRNLNLKPATGKRYFLKFEAAGSVANVYVNGKFLGEHRGAFGAFAYEITDALTTNGNFLEVRVSNAPQPDIAPLSGDFPLYGGLYRPVHLIVTDEQNFCVTDHGSPGVAWLQTSVSKTQAVLDVTAEISNGTNKRNPLKLVVSIFDANNFLVTKKEMDIVAATSMTSPYSLRIVLPNPHLWNGRADPYLYNAVLELRATNEVVDSVEQQIGLRFYWIDPTNGFFLNGKHLRLHGVAKHQERWDKGWAVSADDLDEDISIIEELGANCIRCAHYEHSDYFYHLCDEAGILVWAEIPQVNAIHDTPEFENTSRNQLLDLIRQNINHPAIFVWSLFNEIGPGTDDPHRELQDLNNVAHSEDPTRPTIAATDTAVFPQMNRIPDLLGWNLYYGWYTGTKDALGKRLDQIRYSSQRGGFCMSEYGAGANINQHEENPKQPKAGGAWHPEEWQNEVHEAAWAAISARPFVWGSFAWNIFDFTSYFRHEGGVVGVNDKGLVTADRKIKKDAFYFYKANWSDEPTVYITSRRFVERTNSVTNVKIYSNAKAVKLSLNGNSIGKNNTATNCVFVWENVSLKPGENKIEASAQFDGTNLTDNCVWNLTNSAPAAR
jgi:beta-galactosidase